MRRALVVPVMVALCLVTGETIRGQSCNTTNNGCAPAGRTCFRTFTGSGINACTQVMVNAPATAFSSFGLVTTYRQFNCKGPVGVTAGNCRFINCGACGTFRVDMVNGLPVELMDFSIEDEPPPDEGESGDEG